jgi:hypothetical protein
MGKEMKENNFTIRINDILLLFVPMDAVIWPHVIAMRLTHAVAAMQKHMPRFSL